jgi:hypothetical protein
VLYPQKKGEGIKCVECSGCREPWTKAQDRTEIITPEISTDFFREITNELDRKKSNNNNNKV